MDKLSRFIRRDRISPVDLSVRDSSREEKIAPFRVLVPPSTAVDGVCDLERLANDVLKLCEAVKVTLKTQKEKSSAEAASLHSDRQPDRAGVANLDIDKLQMHEVLLEAS